MASARLKLADFLNLLLPRVCAACSRLMDEEEPGLVCGRCWSRLAPLPAPTCARCGHPTRGLECRWCDRLPVFVRAARSVTWTHRGSALHILHALKYAGWSAAGDAIGERMARTSWPLDVREECRAVVPVPLAAARERERGYNQSLLLATAFGARWGRPVWDDMLFRVRGTRSQTRLTPDDRSRNVSRAFRVATGAERRLSGAHILLVDDVLTTGATLNECATVLYEAGARIVSYVTFGRAPTAADRNQP